MGSIITTNGKGIAINRTFLATPTKTAISQFKVGTGTTEPTIANTDLENSVTLDGISLYFKNFVTGFPTVDTVNNQATTRMFLNTLEANGNNISEVGTFNTDGTPIMFSRTVFTPITKTAVNEITFIQKDRII
jgi:hypothetical protein